MSTNMGELCSERLGEAAEVLFNQALDAAREVEAEALEVTGPVPMHIREQSLREAGVLFSIEAVARIAGVGPRRLVELVFARVTLASKG